MATGGKLFSLDDSSEVVMMVTGSKRLFPNRKKFPFQQVAKLGTSIDEFLLVNCKAKGVREWSEYHVSTNSRSRIAGIPEKFLPVTVTVKEFIERLYKRKSKNNVYTLKIWKIKSTGTRARAPRKSKHDSQPVVIDLVEDDGNMNSGASRDGTSIEPVLANEGVALSSQEPQQGSSRSFSTQSWGRTDNEAVRWSEGIRKKEDEKLKVKKEKKKKFFMRDCDESSCLNDVVAEGLPVEELRPLVKQNLRKLGKSFLIRAKQELGILKKTTDAYGVSKWNKVVQRAPIIGYMVDKMFESDVAE